MRLRASLAAATLFLAFAACGDDETTDPQPGADVADVADTTADVGADASEDTAVDAVQDVTQDAADTGPSAVTFTLVNANPGGLSRWVQVVNGQGVPSWYSVLPSGAVEFLRVHDACTLCACDDLGCTPCTPEPEIVELAPGESVTGEWLGDVFEIDPADFCENAGTAEGTLFQVEFVWSPEPPGEDGTLPVGTLSRTRLQFELGVDTEVRYEIEALAQ